MKDPLLLERYAAAGARRIVDSGGKLEAVVLTQADREWAQRVIAADADPLAPANQVVAAYRRLWLVIVADGEVVVALPNAMLKHAGASGKGKAKARTSEQARSAVMKRWAKKEKNNPLT